MSSRLIKLLSVTLVVCAFTPAAPFLTPALRANDDSQPQSAGSETAADSENSLDEQLRLLSRHDIASDTDSILDFLRRQRPSATQLRETEQLIKQLSNTTFADRESATRKLLNLGLVARAGLAEAAKSKDRETAWRSAWIINQLDSDEQRGLRDSLISSALKILKSRGESKSVLVLLQTLPILDDSQLKGLAFEAIWASTDATHAMLLRKHLTDGNQNVKAAALVALELALGDKAVATLRPYLKTESAVLRLAAARALADRSPHDSITTLVKLVADANDEIAWQADALLQMLSGKQMELSDELTLAVAWQAWNSRELPTAKLNVPIGRKRLDLIAGRNSLHETFSRPAKSMARGYGGFLYEADNTGTAGIVDGKLLIDGDNHEGDQRVYITSDRMIGSAEWPGKFEVRARLGGKEGNNFGWHVGVSVGCVKVLFHPGLSGGGFRAETTDEHEYIIRNEDMGFTPATDETHEMSIKVIRKDDGAEFNITVHDANSKSEFNRKFTVSNTQLGKFNRIGLERSGRRGADAMFDSISIQLGR